MAEERGDLFTQKEFMELIMDIKDEMADFRVELKETKTLIRDYNGLRATINECKERLDKGEGKEVGTQNSKLNIYQVITWIIAIAAIVLAIKK